ncbi:MAG: hypothetical protein WC644_05380 [Ignavibacteria bacterium]
MNQKLNSRFDKKTTEISDVFNKIEGELSRLYESSMISLSGKSKEETRKPDTVFQQKEYKGNWAKLLRMQ